MDCVKYFINGQMCRRAEQILFNGSVRINELDEFPQVNVNLGNKVYSDDVVELRELYHNLVFCCLKVNESHLNECCAHIFIVSSNPSSIKRKRNVSI